MMLTSLTLVPHVNTLDGITLYETINVNALRKLINGDLLQTKISKWKQATYETEKMQLLKYESLIQPNGLVKIQYKKVKGSVWGRCNPNNMVSLFTLRKEIRHTISAKYYEDVDIENCHPQLLYQLCKKFTIPVNHNTLEMYATRRDKSLDQIQTVYSVGADDAKLLFIIILYGGTFATWADEVGVDIKKHPSIKIIDDLSNEIDAIAAYITLLNPDIKNSVIERKKQQGIMDYNIEKVTLSVFLQEIEVRILEACYLFLVNNDYIEKGNAVLCADGLMIDKTKYKPQILSELSKLIDDTFGLQIMFKNKPMERGYADDVLIQHLTYDLHAPVFSTGMLSDYFKLLYEQFVYHDNILYFYNGVYWKEDKDGIHIRNFIDHIFYKDLLSYYFNRVQQLTHDASFNDACSISNLSSVSATEIDDDISNETSPEKRAYKLLRRFNRNISNLKQYDFKNKLMKDICDKLNNEYIVFDNNPYIFAFRNAIFDLSQGVLIQPDKEQYITTTCGYDYDFHYSKTKVETVEKMIDTMFVNKDNKEYYLDVLATGLIGQLIQHFFIATGVGGNGKSSLNELMLEAVGNYGYKLPNNLLLTDTKTGSGANPQLALMHKKRFGIACEPPSNSRISTSMIKELTGNRKLNARNIFSDKCDKVLCITLVMECNELPRLDEVSDAVQRRIRAIPFTTEFKSGDAYEANKMNPNVYEANPEYTTELFSATHKQALFEILVVRCKQIIVNKLKLRNAPEECRKLTADYLVSSDTIYEWICEKYEKTDKETDMIYIKNMYELFKSGTYYENMTKADKRLMNLKNFDDKIQKNIYLKALYKQRDTYVGKLKLSKPCIVYFKEGVSPQNPGADGS